MMLDSVWHPTTINTGGAVAIIAEAVRPSVEVALTPSMKASFQNGDLVALSQGHQAMHRSHQAVDTSAFRHLVELERELVVHFLEPLVPAVLAALSPDQHPQHAVRRPSATASNAKHGTSSQGVRETETVDDDERLLRSSSSSSHAAAAVPLSLSGMVGGGLPLGAVAPMSVGPRDVLEALRWAHFCVRSRSVNLNHHVRSVDPAVPLPAMVPLVDMFNHCALAPNVVFRTLQDHHQQPPPLFQEHQQHRASTSSGIGAADHTRIAIVAVRDIPAGAELLMHYGDYWRRTVLHDLLQGACRSKPSAQQQIDADLKALRAEMRWERTAVHQGSSAPDGVTDTGAAAFRTAAVASTEVRRLNSAADALVPSGPAHRRLVPQEVADAKRTRDPQSQLGKARDGVSAAEWAWTFGFVKPEAEAHKEANDRWRRQLFDAAAKLTAPLSRAERGKFVVGVPAGLDMLKAQREQLVREKYQGQQVFPPQRTHN